MDILYNRLGNKEVRREKRGKARKAGKEEYRGPAFAKAMAGKQMTDDREQKKKDTRLRTLATPERLRRGKEGGHLGRLKG